MSRLGSAYFLDDYFGEQTAQPRGHRAVGELAQTGSMVADHHGGCAPGAGDVGQRLRRI
jgi:hypothetical protein